MVLRGELGDFFLAEKKPILFEMNNVPYNLDQLLACKKGPYQWMKENLRENGLREDEMGEWQ